MIKPASLKTIKQELSLLPNQEVIQILLKLVRHRKENKELVSFILFDSKDEASYIRQMKLDMDESMKPVTLSNYATSLKYIRRVLRNTKKIARYSTHNEMEVELLMHFCSILKSKNLPVKEVKGLSKMWDRCIQCILKAISTLHEDLKYDYQTELDTLLRDI